MALIQSASSKQRRGWRHRLDGSPPGVWGLCAPAGIRKAIVDKLAAASCTTLDMPDIQACMLELGSQAAFVPGDELQAVTAKDANLNNN